MEVGTVLSVAQTLFAAVQCPELRRIFAMFGYSSELDNLRRTVATVRAVLRDAEAKQDDLLSMSNQSQFFIDELKDAVYDADDLLDEFIAMAELRKLHLVEKGAAIGELRLFFSRFNRLSFARKMNKSVAKIRKKLDAIAVNYAQFGFKVDYEPIRVRREETCSYVNEGEIIGRDVDVENLVEMLMRDDDVGCCNFVTIVGIGGLGKTSLAQLVYNDDRVKSEFSLRAWVCVSDQDANEFCVKDILVRVLKSVTTGNDCDGYTLDQVQIELQKWLGENKFLLVLDDVWTEDREQWLKLERFLRCGKEGSWIVVTTRSKQTARIVGNGVMYMLKGLSLEHSRRLFEKTAFGLGNPPEEFVEIGHQIVDRCANVPLAVRVVGSLLYGQSISKWHSFQEKGLGYISDHKNGIKSILKLSYHNLKSPLKSCFSYCAIFPKDFVIVKETLISLWMAQGYVVPFGEGQSLEDAAEECFLILLRRCFFQDVKRDEYGEIVSCKVHDLMHDIARDVSGKEICEVIGSNNTILDERVRHVSYTDGNFLKRSQSMTQIRTCLRVGGKDNELLMRLILANCVRLRSLTLSYLEVTVLPESLGNLLHLRYLDLSCNGMLKRLPKSTTKLYNLLTLKLFNCWELKTLPDDLSKLRKLQILAISGCHDLKYLPSGMGKLAHLHTLSNYMIGRESLTMKECVNQQEELESLTNLKGSIEINIHVPKIARYFKDDNRKGAYMRNKEHLDCIEFTFEHVENNGSFEYEEAILEGLQPHSNLAELIIRGFEGMRLPSWGRDENLANCLPNLVKLEIVSCDGLEYLPNLRRLSHLKELLLVDLQKLEYVENEIPTVTSCNEQLLSFPCLEHIHLQRLPSLKMWLRGSTVFNNIGDCLPRVKKMVIVECPELSSAMSGLQAEGLSRFDSFKDWILKSYDHDLGMFRCSTF